MIFILCAMILATSLTVMLGLRGKLLLTMEPFISSGIRTLRLRLLAASALAAAAEEETAEDAEQRDELNEAVDVLVSVCKE